MYGDMFGGYSFMGAQMPPNNPFMGQQTPFMSQPTAQQNNSPVVLYASSAKEFGNVSVQPGRQALAISQNDPFIAFKSADAMGMVQTTIAPGKQGAIFCVYNVKIVL